MLHTQDVLNLSGKIAVVTGGASGIGLATAGLLADFGAHVVVLDINVRQGEQAVHEMKERGRKASFHRCDVSSSEDCKRAASEIENAYGKVDILFNNAGIIRRKTVVELGGSRLGSGNGCIT